MLRKQRFKLLWLSPLLASACSSAPARDFQPIDNCRLKTVQIAAAPNGMMTWIFSCKKTDGTIYQISIGSPDSQDLVCFKAEDFKTFNETCHQ